LLAAFSWAKAGAAARTTATNSIIKRFIPNLLVVGPYEMCGLIVPLPGTRLVIYFGEQEREAVSR
jgi:hypothetical protein